MAPNRVTKSTEYVRHVFTESERLQMGSDLASSYSRLSAIEEEENAVKAGFKERKTTIEKTIGSLSRDLGSGWTMQNVDCRLEYDTPNAYEVSYIRVDTGETVRVRAMTIEERQMDLPLPGDVVVVAPEESAANITEFFGDKSGDVAADPEESSEGEDAVEDEQLEAQDEFAAEPATEDIFSDPDPSAAKEAVKAENDEAFGVPLDKPAAKPGRKPKGFSGPTNASAF